MAGTRLLSCASIAAILLAPAAAHAQRPMLLGETPTRADAAIQTYAGYDRADARSMSGDQETRRNGDGTSVGVSGMIDLSRPLGRSDLNLDASTDVRYYTTAGALSGVTAESSQLAMGLQRRVARRVSMRLGQSVGTSSFYQYDPFSGLVAATGAEDITLASADYRVARGRSFTYEAHTGVDIQAGRYTTVSLEGNVRYVRFPGEQISYRSEGGGGRLERRLTRHTSFRAGYGYDYGGSVRGVGTAYHRLDLGLSYDSPLSFSRSTFVNASTGAAITARRDGPTGEQHRVPGFTATGGLRQQIGRSWLAGLQYRREPQHLELYSTPAYVDVVAGSLRGRVARRASLLLAGGYSRSTVDLGSRTTTNEAAFGSLRLTTSLTRRIGIYGEYGYYAFDSAGTFLATTASSRVGRQAVRGGLSWALPLISPRQLP